VIEYASAKRAELVGDEPSRGPKVAVQLRLGVVDVTAPPGSMMRQRASKLSTERLNH